MLNNRELASVIIIVTLVGVACLGRDIRSSFGGVIKAAFTPKLSLLWLLYGSCIAAAEFGLLKAGLDYDGCIKDAVLWAVIAGLPIFVKFDKAAKDPTLLRRAIFDALRVTALVELFVNLYVFPLWVELPMQLLLGFVAVMVAFAETQEATPPEVSKFLSGLATLGGFTILIVVAVHVSTHFSDINWRDTGLSFLQPLVLTVAAVLATTAVMFVAAYERALGVDLRYPLGECEARLRHRLAVFLGLHFHVRKVEGFHGAVSVRLRQTDSFRAALNVVRNYRAGRIAPTDWPGIDSAEPPG